MRAIPLLAIGGLPAAPALADRRFAGAADWRDHEQALDPARIEWNFS